MTPTIVVIPREPHFYEKVVRTSYDLEHEDSTRARIGLTLGATRCYASNRSHTHHRSGGHS